MRISDWSSDVCSSDLHQHEPTAGAAGAVVVQASGSTHADHAGCHDHGAMIADYRRRFWVTLVLTPPVLLLSPMIQHWLGLAETISFPGDGLLQIGRAHV